MIEAYEQGWILHYLKNLLNKDFQFAINGLIKAIKGTEPKKTKANNDVYFPELIHADTNIAQLAHKIKNNNILNFSLCLYGPPGTGKSAYARYLAKELSMPVILKRASDLLGMYVGETEKNIAAAFAEAKEKKGFLIFDEADSLLGDRRMAQRSWEVSQVNEMLTWMEQHPFPFACTTNLKERLDQASMRRFTIKTHFDYLQIAQVTIAFKHFFDQEVSIHKIKHLIYLTPGDFAVVKKQLIFENELPQHEIIALLKHEMEAKEVSSHRGRIGFVA